MDEAELLSMVHSAQAYALKEDGALIGQDFLNEYMKRLYTISPL